MLLHYNNSYLSSLSNWIFIQLRSISLYWIDFRGVITHFQTDETSFFQPTTNKRTWKHRTIFNKHWSFFFTKWEPKRRLDLNGRNKPDIYNMRMERIKPSQAKKSRPNHEQSNTERITQRLSRKKIEKKIRQQPR